MGWFDEQIELRKRSDREVFEDSCLKIAGAVTGQNLTALFHDEREQTTDAIGEILRYYNVRTREIPEKLQSIDEVLEYLLRPAGFMTRNVKLKQGWRKNASGAMLTTLVEEGKPIALIPSGMSGYKYKDPVTGVMRRVKKNNENIFTDDAIAFYKPFPNKKLGFIDIFKYIFNNFDKGSLTAYCIFALIAVFVGMVNPILNNILFSDVITLKKESVLIAIAVFMLCVSVSSILFGTVQELFLKRITLKLENNIESATMMRILMLPSSFFRGYASGDLASRVEYMNLLVTHLVEMVFSGLITAIFSLLYVFQIFVFAPALVVPALVVTGSVFVIIIASVILRTKINSIQLELEAEDNGLSYAIISGIEKIKLSGAAKRAFAKWGRSYSAQSSYLYNPPLFIKVSTVLTNAIPLIGTIVIYYAAISSNVSVGQYYAFNSAYGMIIGAFASLALMIVPASHIIPILRMVRPIMETVPEVSEEKPVIDRLSGGIELTNVSFRYNEDMPYILDNFSLKIRSGEYIAITGKTGCGKSTLMRLLLGFETPQKGAIYYDGRDLNNIDLKSLRSRIGTVMQNGMLFSGDIYSNIIISAPHLSIEEAWEAAEIAGIADDIREMPMNMFTMISEGSGGISGGQKQRLMIARAVAPKPKILMFDEATSALDNITQKHVSDALETLKCTRIVIAHRLSTIRHCDRIIVLDDGRIVEDGSYDELMEKKGHFAELVRRQQLEQA